MKGFAKLVFRLLGWQMVGKPKGVKKAVVAMGPHTSNWDFIIGRLAFWYFGVSASFLIKKELFFPPFGWILKAMGGIPIDRKKNNNFTSQAVQYFEESESMYMVFTPEGTRSYNPNWKKGFYYIALAAKVPIYIGFIDYKNKIGGFGSVVEPTGDIKKDIEFMKRELSQYSGKHPEQGIKSPEKE